MDLYERGTPGSLGSNREFDSVPNKQSPPSSVHAHDDGLLKRVGIDVCGRVCLCTVCVQVFWQTWVSKVLMF